MSASQFEAPNVLKLPGLTNPIPVESVTDLIHGSIVNGQLDEAGQVDWYRFNVEAGVPIIIEIEADTDEYSVEYFRKLIEKGEPAEMSLPMPDTTIRTVTYSFNEDMHNELFLSVAGSDSSTPPSRGYTIRMIANLAT
ncbi:MAG: hypothetical protein AAF702_09415 [Chloroflexota bacterium]